MRTTFGQLPGLQKAARILELQEKIPIHVKFSSQLAEIFNTLYERDMPVTAGTVQHIAEWHLSQAAFLEVELKELKGP